jgi:hypothetical protein
MARHIVVLLIIVAATVVASMSVANGQARDAWVAFLSNAEEVPRNNSTATGMASFQLAPGGAGLLFWLSVDNLNNVQMAHIHIAPAGQNGPVAVWLYPAAPPPRLIQGVSNAMIGSGTITPANFAGGPLAGQQLTALINAINAGNAYVNVHTQAFPGGEIRGQIR